MIVLVQANVLAVGLKDRVEALQDLPIRLIAMQSAKEAARSLKNERVDSVISNWDLDDMKDGRFLKRLRCVKPEMPTIAFVKSDDFGQEIAARSCGVSAVLTENSDNELLQETLANILGLKSVIPQTAAQAETARRYNRAVK